jgi:hypothetical protein
LAIERERSADLIDSADYYIESVIDDHVKEAMRKAADIPIGNPGICDLCGHEYTRLVNGACGFCRDKYGLE